MPLHMPCFLEICFSQEAWVKTNQTSAVQCLICVSSARRGVHTAVLLTVQVCWDVMLGNLFSVF